jgi:flagellar basal-body rod modification protein FlgD
MTSIQAVSGYGPLASSSTGAGPVGTVGVTEDRTSDVGSEAFSNLDEDVFLKLLVAQMKYQDPASPTDPTQFLTQTAQFTVVEKLSALETANQKVLDAANAQAAASMLGKTVTYTDASGTSRTGVVTATSFGSQNPTLTVGGLSVELDKVTRIATA